MGWEEELAAIKNNYPAPSEGGTNNQTQDQPWWDKYGGTVTAAAGELGNAYMNQQGQRQVIDASRQGQQAYANAAQQAMGVQGDMLGQQQAGLAPWITAGLTSLPQMTQMASQSPVGEFDVTKTQGYQFRMDEGMKALENSMAARGLSSSGAAMKGMTRYGQDYASQEYGNEWNRRMQEGQTQWGRLAGLANQGYGAEGQRQNALGAYGTNVGNTMLQTGQMAANALGTQGGARSSAYTGYGNALSNTSQSLADQLMLNQLGPEQYVNWTNRSA